MPGHQLEQNRPVIGCLSVEDGSFSARIGVRSEQIIDALCRLVSGERKRGAGTACDEQILPAGLLEHFRDRAVRLRVEIAAEYREAAVLLRIRHAEQRARLLN